MVSRVLVSLVLAATLTIGMASAVLADTFPGPAGNQTTAYAAFTRVVNGVRYDWWLSADRDTVAGYSRVSASYSATIDITCHGGEWDGQPGNRFISFYGEVDKRFIVAGKLAAAVAGGKVSGTQDTYDTCTDTSTSRAKTVTFKFALHATSRLSTYTREQCVDFSEEGDSPQRLTQTGKGRTAAGTALVNGRRFAITDGGIGHLRWNSVDDPSCAEPT
jgi:hypothetical protein